MKSILQVVLGVLLGFSLAAGIWLSSRAPQGESVELRPAPTPDPLQVHIAGAVVRPGVYELQEDGRVLDAVEAAGGFVAEADKNSLNLAAFVEDGARLDIPYVAGYTPSAEAGFVIVSEGTPSPLLEDLVDINTATIAELDELPGIGPTIAQYIITYRTQNGPFKRIEDIVNVSGISQSTFNMIKDLITVGE